MVANGTSDWHIPTSVLLGFGFLGTEIPRTSPPGHFQGSFFPPPGSGTCLELANKYSLDSDEHGGFYTVLMIGIGPIALLHWYRCCPLQ
jgi:hypothetical protein